MTKRIFIEIAKACVLDSLKRWQGVWATQDELVADACAQTEMPKSAVTEPVKTALGLLVKMGTIEKAENGSGFRLTSA